MTHQHQRNTRRFIEAGFPCHQVGAETQRERDTGKAPPTHRLHVWWARRPLTPSRAAILGSLLPADTDPEWFLRQLGIEKVQAIVNGQPWTLTGQMLNRIVSNDSDEKWIKVDHTVLRWLKKEQERRAKNRAVIQKLCAAEPSLKNHPVIVRWEQESQPLPEPLPETGAFLPVQFTAADPAHVNERIEFRKSCLIKIVPGFSWDNEDLYGYDRAFEKNTFISGNQLTLLDPTAGGGSIPFEALRMGLNVVANDLNPVAFVILKATLDYPTRFGKDLIYDIEKWATILLNACENNMKKYYPNLSPVPITEKQLLINHLEKCPELIPEFDKEDIIDYLYTRQVTCPHCGGEAPLLNSCWLSKEGEKWGVRIVPDGRPKNGKVRFETYRVTNNRGPNGEDPNFATVNDGVGVCIHCRQAIPADEIKAQARGESPHGRWTDRLYCVVAVRYQPKLDKNGNPQRYTSGEKAGQIKTEKVRFFRPPNEQDLQALAEAEKRLQEKWPEWERMGLIPTENIPEGHKTVEPLRFGMTRWCDMFTPRQLLGHLTLVEELNRIKPQIISELGEERGRAVVTYLQFMIDKGLDYNSKQTRWIPQRQIVSGTFGRHDFSLKWTFGEMIFTGPNSGVAWALSQVLDAYAGIAKLVKPLHEKLNGKEPPVTILHGTAAHTSLPDRSVDLICMDPPYYNNVQYAELSDYFYVWQRRTLHDLYPDIYRRRLTNKKDEAVANPARDGNETNAKQEYERMMNEIFSECRRVLKDDGIMTVMFTHKTQVAWEALTRSLIEQGWVITSSLPVESEFTNSQHIAGNASAASSIFISCRKRLKDNNEPATWSGFGGTGVAHKVREAVREGLKEFAPLKLNPVDEMVASYGRALQLLSENWPVLDGDELVTPIRAMREASAVVAEYQVARITDNRLKVDDLNPETAMALTLFGIFGLSDFPYDEALSLSRSLNIALEAKPAGYAVKGRMIGINNESNSRRSREHREEETGYHAPLLRKNSKLRLAKPEERNKRRLEHPQTEWDMLQGLIMSYRQGDVPVARAYLTQHAQGREQVIVDLLSVWAAEVTEEALRKEAEALLFGLKM